jgi:glycosyltransferase involved in cell wall biosynthesis
MRIYLHDYAGHPFQVQLARALASRGHTVRHGYSSTNVTPHGRLGRHDDDPVEFELDAIALTRVIDKTQNSMTGLRARRRSEREYGNRVVAHLSRFKPDVVIAANTPLDALNAIQSWCGANDVPLVNWLQDLISVAAHKLLRRRIPVFGALAGRYYLAVERRILRRSDAIVVITEDFRPILRRWGISAARVTAIENWAPIDELPIRPQANSWSRTHGLDDRRVLLYSGTLGLKHNPELLLRLAERFRDDEGIRVVVITEGPGAEWLRERAAGAGLENLLLLPYQPFEFLPDVLGTAAVLLAVLEPDAGVYSVPSKVLTYLCAARPLLLAVPDENLAARIVTRIGAGVLVSPTEPESFVEAAERLLANDALRDEAGRRAREYAEETFDVVRIADRFEAVLKAVRT